MYVRTRAARRCGIHTVQLSSNVRRTRPLAPNNAPLCRCVTPANMQPMPHSWAAGTHLTTHAARAHSNFCKPALLFFDHSFVLCALANVVLHECVLNAFKIMSIPCVPFRYHGTHTTSGTGNPQLPLIRRLSRTRSRIMWSFLCVAATWITTLEIKSNHMPINVICQRARAFHMSHTPGTRVCT